ncbi:MAG: hypothetical protein NZM35_09245 [Chitinophagales bacterium]|nr:hypothetical protein [Chitinophagales bacterium]MDW8419043.1 hypothetical protein [Chitinophagales bacterium]
MKTVLFTTLLLFACYNHLVAQDDFEWVKKLENVTATVEILADGETAVLIPDDNTNARYVSQQMPAAFKINRLKVTFTGMEGKIPPHVRMLGKPLKLFSISISKKDKRKYKLRKSKYTF